MSEIELKQRLHDANRHIDVLHADLRLVQAAYADAVTENSRLKEAMAMLLRERQGNDVY